MKLLSSLFYILFAGVALVGFAYFGPPQYTKFMTDNTFFRMKVVPMIDQMLALGGSEESTVGYVTDVRNQVDYRPPSALSPIQVRGGERLPQGTIVSSGSESTSMIRLIDDSIITLGENSTLQIELPEGPGKIATIELKVLEGSVTAQQSEVSQSKIRLRNAAGVVTEVNQQRTIVGAKSKMAHVLKAGQKSSDLESIERERAQAEENARQREAEAQRQEEQRLAQEQEQERLRQEQELQAQKEMERQKQEQERLAAENERKKAEQEKARRLRARRAKVESKITQARVQNREVAGKTDISLGLYEKKRGNVETSQRYMAKALTNQGYSGDVFNDATRIAMDNVMSGYVEGGDCATSLDFIKNVARSYQKDERARRWAARWHGRLKEARCAQ